MDSVKPFLDWRQTKEIHHHKSENHTHVTSSTDKILADLAKRISLLERGQVMLAEAFEKSPLAGRVRHLEERLSAGATMADLQLVVEAVLKQGDDMKILAGKVLSQEANVDWLERNTAHKDLFLKKEQVQ